MENYVFGTIGILVSVALFLVGYRQTIGARKEKIRAASIEIEKILVKRIILESYTPSPDDLSRLVEGKARDFNLRSHDLMSKSQIINIIFTRIIETDFITPEQRRDVFNRINPVLIQVDAQSIEESEIETFPSVKTQLLENIVIPIVTGLILSLIGGLIAIIPNLSQSKLKFEQTSAILIVIASISFLIIIVLFVIYKIRESQEEPNDERTEIQKHVNFEKEVAKTLEKYGASVKIAKSKNQEYDFFIAQGNKKLVIEVKNWSKDVSLLALKKVIERASSALNKESADEAIIITRSKIQIPSTLLLSESVKIMTLTEFRDYIAHI